MSQSLTLARPYARAAFAASRNDGRAASWSQALAFAAQVAADPRVQTLLSHPQLSNDDAVVLLATDGADEELRRFIGLLAENQRLAVGTGADTTVLGSIISAAPEMLKVARTVERVASADTAVETAVRAVRRARAERRTVLLNLPLGVQGLDTSVDPSGVAPYVEPPPLAPGPGDVDLLAGALSRAQRPVFVAGRGARGARGARRRSRRRARGSSPRRRRAGHRRAARGRSARRRRRCCAR